MIIVIKGAFTKRRLRRDSAETLLDAKARTTRVETK